MPLCKCHLISIRMLQAIFFAIENTITRYQMIMIKDRSGQGRAKSMSWGHMPPLASWLYYKKATRDLLGYFDRTLSKLSMAAMLHAGAIFWAHQTFSVNCIQNNRMHLKARIHSMKMERNGDTAAQIKEVMNFTMGAWCKPSQKGNFAIKNVSIELMLMSVHAHLISTTNVEP